MILHWRGGRGREGERFTLNKYMVVLIVRDTLLYMAEGYTEENIIVSFHVVLYNNERRISNQSVK